MSPVIARSGIGNIKRHMVDLEDATLPPVRVALDSNESAFGPSPAARRAAIKAVAHIERYQENPDRILAPAIAERFGLSPERIAIGQGSDDLLSRLARAYLGPGTEMIRSVNGYLKTPNYAFANDAKPVAAPDCDFRASIDSMLACVTERTRMVYLANPENPAGTHLSGREVRRLHAGLPAHVLLVLDCAYEEYVDADDYEPGHRLVEEAHNVVMARTFSKIFGLAGARIGWLYAPPDILDPVRRIGLTFPVSAPSVAAALAALGDRAHTEHVHRVNARQRTWATQELTAGGLKVYPSQGNFVLVRFPRPGAAKAAWLTLRRRGIATRRFAAPAYKDCLRMTIGLEEETREAVDALLDFVGTPAEFAATRDRATIT